MKKVIVFLAGGLLSLLSVGCSNNLSVNPTAVSASKEATASISINLLPIPVLGKKAVSIVPVMILLWGRTSDRCDTLMFSGTGVKTFYIGGFQRGKTYTFQALCYSADGTQLNMGYVNNVLFGDVDTFSVEMALLPLVSQLKAKVGLKGTVLESKACSLSVKSTLVGSTGQPVINFFRFAPGALDTVRIDTLIPINGNYVGQYTDYSIEVCIYLANNEGFYLGTGSVRLYQSTNATLVITLTKYGTSGSLAKMVINISPYGRLDFSVSLP